MIIYLLNFFFFFFFFFFLFYFQLIRLDNRIKETNMIYQIFGGYLRSQVKCLECKYNSNTYDPCLDISLDIKGCDSVKRALELFVKPEILSKGNKYKCSR